MDPLSSIFRGHPIHEDSSLPATKSIVKQWVQDCTQHHSLCGPPKGSDAPLPTRVIDVGTSSFSEIKLVETGGTLKGHYTTLSYQWGPKPHLYEMTQSSLSIYKSGIKFTGKIPQTIIDAIDITRHIGIRYLWIDALCIIQDSAADWVKESAKMLDYYGNSYLTISAAASDSAYKGIFHKRDTPPSIDIPYTSESGSKGTLTISTLDPEKENTQMEYVSFNGNPIIDRAWTLQERLLSTRNIFYANDQMYYECNEHFLSEDGLRVHGRGTSIDPNTKNLDFYPTTEKLTLRAMWDLLVQDYAGREMFNPDDDKFVAISGLAQKLGTLFPGDMYVAGLWKTRLVELLFWSTAGGGPPWQNDWPPAKYRAPSWSWANIDATICNPDERIYASEMYATYVAHKITLKDKDHLYGRITDAYITLNVPKPVHLQLVKTTSHDGDWALWEDSTKKKISVVHSWDYDTWSDPQMQTLDMYALVLARNVPSEEENASDIFYLCLLITPVSGRSSYRRIGTVWLGEHAMGSHAPRYSDKSEYVAVTLI